ncbi:FAD dependent oxidoreductase, partial [Aureobasidium melanogenum]
NLSTMNTSSESTVILGAGIIGVSTAYYLSQSKPGSSIHLVDSSPELFASASGKAGGFLAADWFGPASAPLGLLSFKLHKQLADEHDGAQKWGYSRSTGASFAEGEDPTGEEAREGEWLESGRSRAEVAGAHEFVEGEGPAWLTRRKGDGYDVVSADETVAQVNPLRLSQFLLDECRKRGVKVHQPATPTSVSTDTNNTMTSLNIKQTDGSETQVTCTSLLFACGAWTPKVFRTLFPSSTLKLPISPYAGHSIVISSPNWTTSHEQNGCHAIFSTSSSGFSPELISRIGGEIYIAGLNDGGIPLPDLATEAKIEASAIAELKKTAERMCGIPGQEIKITREGLCFRPVTPRGEPILCQVEDKKLGGVKCQGGVFVAAGHGPWGISLSLGTGLIMSEMIRGVKTSCKVGRLRMQ